MTITSIHQSQLGQFLRCSEQFRRRYINGEIIPPGVAAHRGRGFHKAAEVNHVQKVESKKDLPADDLKDAARDEFLKSSKDQGVFIPKSKASDTKQIIQQAFDETINATGFYSETIAHTIDPVAAELRIETDIGLSMPIEGTLDLIVPQAIRDFKVRGKRSAASWAHNELQVDFYWELYREQFEEYPQYFQYDEIIMLKTKTDWVATETKRESPERLKAYCNLFIRALETGLFPPAQPDSWQCSEAWCGWYKVCAYTKGIKYFT